MKAFDIVAYAYEAAMHCPSCAEQRFGAEALTNPATRDSEGNPITPLFAGNVEKAETCDDHHGVIFGTEDYP